MKRQRNRLLLHTCCADCAIKFIRSIDNQYEITLYFDNDNIHPRTEYLERLKSVQKITKEENLPIVVANWSPKLWFEAIKDNEENIDNRRCNICWKHRLSKTSKYAIENDFDLFSTTLLTSHYQNKIEIKKIGKKLNVKNLKFYIPEKFENIKTSGFYKQNYCGCIYSLKDRYFEKYSS